MDHFTYSDGSLHCEGVSIESIADAVGTPTYVYSAATLRDHLRRLVEAWSAMSPRICFSVKSCPNLAVLRTLVDSGAGMDVVSGGELVRARRAGCAASHIVYAGVGKSDAEIRLALREGIGLFNIESEPELENVQRLAADEGCTAHCALRVNPDVDPQTHRHTTTGTRETKFGVDLERALELFRRHGRNAHAVLDGIHLHIGSPVYRTEPYLESVRRALGLIDALAAEGVRIRTLDLGGGFGADYETGQSPDARRYADAVEPLLAPRVRDGLALILEPGRTIAANAGVLVSRVHYVKRGGGKTFVICDAGMHTLLRPSHYEAFHFMWPVRPGSAMVPARRARDMGMDGLETVDVVGPLCETGDYLALDRALPPMGRGELLAVFTAGAYGMSMASRYNSHALPAEVIVDGAIPRLVRQRECVEDMLAHEDAVGTPIAAPIAAPNAVPHAAPTAAASARAHAGAVSQ
jgi:diaminopimelate decarboxylase